MKLITENLLVIAFAAVVIYIIYLIKTSSSERFTDFSKDYEKEIQELRKTIIETKTMKDVEQELLPPEHEPYEKENLLDSSVETDTRNDLLFGKAKSDEKYNNLGKDKGTGVGWMKDEEAMPEFYGQQPKSLPY